jgi:hypothetical protein
LRKEKIMADSFEYMKLYVPLTYNRGALGLQNFAVAYSGSDAESNKEWDKANQLGKEGWELVGSVPCISSAYDGSLGIFPYTGGYILLFKRRL